MVSSVNISAMAEFFSILYPELIWPGVIQIIIRDPHKEWKEGKEVKKSKLINTLILRKREDVKELQESALNIYDSQGYDFFYMCGFSDGLGTKTENVRAISFLWADVDHVNEEEMQARLRGVPVPPSMVVSSGGGFHLYWILDGYYSVDAELETALKRVAKWVGGDHTQNVNRLLRVVGSRNHGKTKGYEEPRDVKIVHKLGARYALAEFSKSAITYAGIKLPEKFKEAYILNGEVIGDGERSTRDFAVIKELLLAGHSDEEIVSIFENPAFGVSSKAIERKGTNYLSETIKKAKTETASVHKAAVCDDGEKVIRRGMTAKGILNEEVISNFAIKLHRTVEIVGTTTELIEGSVVYRHREKVFLLEASEFLTWKHFMTVIEMQGLGWIGSDTDWQQYKMWLFDREMDVHKATNVIGWHKNSFVTQDRTFFNDNIRYFKHQTLSPRVKITVEGSENIPHILPRILEAAKDLREWVALPMIGWAAAAAFAPQVRDACNRGFPPMVLEGQRGSGKTTLAHIVTEYLLGVEESYSIKTTEAGLKRALAGTNSFPIFLDEYLPGFFKADFDSLIRLAYQGGYAQTATDKVSLAMLGPMCITTTPGVEDEQIIDRSYIMRLSEIEDNEKEKGLAAVRTFELLPKGAFMYWWLQQDPKSWLDEIPRLRELVKNHTPRQQVAFATAMAPLKALFPYYITDEKMLHWFDLHHKLIVHISPNESLDIALSEAFRSKRLLQVHDWQFDLEDTDWIRLSCKRAVDEMLMLPKEIDVGHKFSRKWLQKTLAECKWVKNWQKLMRVGDGQNQGKVMAAMLLNWKKMPHTREVIE